MAPEVVGSSPIIRPRIIKTARVEAVFLFLYLAPGFDFGAEAVETLIEIFIAAVDIVDIAQNTRPRCG